MANDDRRIFEAYSGEVTFTTARGVEVKGRCLTVVRALRCMEIDRRMREQADLVAEAQLEFAAAEQRGDRGAAQASSALYCTAAAEMSKAFTQLVDEFQKAAEIGESRVSPAEVVQEVLPYFLAVSGTTTPKLQSPGPTSSTSAPQH